MLERTSYCSPLLAVAVASAMVCAPALAQVTPATPTGVADFPASDREPTANALDENYACYFGGRSASTYAVAGPPRQLRLTLRGSF